MANAHGKSPHTTVSVSLFYTDGQSFNDNEPETIRERTIHEKPDRPRFSICNQREIGGSEPVFSS